MYRDVLRHPLLPTEQIHVALESDRQYIWGNLIKLYSPCNTGLMGFSMFLYYFCTTHVSSWLDLGPYVLLSELTSLLTALCEHTEHRVVPDNVKGKSEGIETTHSLCVLRSTQRRTYCKLADKSIQGEMG